MLTAVAEEWAIGLIFLGVLFFVGGWLGVWLGKPDPDIPEGDDFTYLARGWYLAGLWTRRLGAVAVSVGLALELFLAVRS